MYTTRSKHVPANPYLAILSAWVLLSFLSTPLYAQQINPRAEVAAALYAASATQAAAERAADARIRAQRAEIDSLRTINKQSSGQNEQLQQQLTEAEESFVAALEEKDRAYREAIAVFRNAVEDIASTPEGAAALALFNSGDEVGALKILDDLVDGQEAALEVAKNIQIAAGRRSNATLALEARNSGKLTTEDVIARFEEVTRLDPGVHWDWVELGRLYTDAGNLDDANRAAVRAIETAQNSRDRSAGLVTHGDVQVRLGDLSGALSSYRQSFEIFKGLSESWPDNAVFQRDLSVSLERIGEVQVDLGNMSGALTSYRESLIIVEGLSKSDPSNAGWQHDLAVALEKIGDVQAIRDDLEAARSSYRESLAIFKGLAKLDLGNAALQRSLSVSFDKLGDVQVSLEDFKGALLSYRESLEIRESLAKSDPGNTVWQRDLSISIGNIGTVQVYQSDMDGALSSFRKSLAIIKSLANSDPDNAEWQRDLIVCYVKIGKASGDKNYTRKALDVALSMQSEGVLAPSDAWMIRALQGMLEQ